jgi:hypothetical protein
MYDHSGWYASQDSRNHLDVQIFDILPQHRHLIRFAQIG